MLTILRIEHMKDVLDRIPGVEAMGITLVPWMMVPGQERIVAGRFKEVLETKETARQRSPRSESELA
ncbi:MAG: hypothetical protein IPM24_09640 [Bryobacterales bacterium]|nr:hypothetical protein [Bryobacterales bacterium]